VAADQPLDWATANGLTPFLVGDALKLGVAAVAFPAAWWVVGRRPGDR
jgi:biotin transport system substrate-specific component